MALTRYYEKIRRYMIMENMVKMIAAHTSNLLEFASLQGAVNDCAIKILKEHGAKIASMQGQIKANTFFIGCIIGYLIVTRKK